MTYGVIHGKVLFPISKVKLYNLGRPLFHILKSGYLHQFSGCRMQYVYISHKSIIAIKYLIIMYI